MDLRHLRSLLALAETGSVSAAARRVHLTQSALSHQLRAIERRFGVPVVRRKGRGVALTAAGERLAAAARAVADVIRSAERDVMKLAAGEGGSLRIALECHTCFDWLMPVMDRFRRHWPQVELDLVSGFHPEPTDLLLEDRADLVIGSERRAYKGLVHWPLFRFEILGILPVSHPLAARRYLSPEDFRSETLITYPVPEQRIDLIRRFLRPARVRPAAVRTAELTVAILQLVASRRGIAALPNWGVKSYVDYEYVIARRLGKKGLWGELYATCTAEAAARPYLADFIETAKEECFRTLDGVRPLTAGENQSSRGSS